MKLTVLITVLTFSFSSLAMTPDFVKCLKDAKKSGIKMESAYQRCSVSEGSSGESSSQRRRQ